LLARTCRRRRCRSISHRRLRALLLLDCSWLGCCRQLASWRHRWWCLGRYGRCLLLMLVLWQGCCLGLLGGPRSKPAADKIRAQPTGQLLEQLVRQQANF
jgi:hypothetical protein